MTAEIPESVLAPIRRTAMTGHSDGTRRAESYIRRCGYFHGHSGTQIFLTRDIGHHTSGWLKNPDFERCWHLSLSFREPVPTWPIDRIANSYTLAMLGGIFPLAPFDWPLARRWVDLILGDRQRFAWTESPKTPIGQKLSVMHWRVFCDVNWEPIKPRGEVYSKEFTRHGWRSWSDAGIERPSHIDAD